MRKNWGALRAKMSPERQAANRAATQQMLAQLPLHEIRRARKLSQQTLAKSMGRSQPEISNLEHRTDTYVSTLRSYIEAMGGSLDIVAHFRDGDYRITQFGDIGDDDLIEA
ncbi:MAG: helix-turn-helix domain-containing protein [Candidatus Eremiobacteraeota bacterium]|nr:helix-turn-helix domain-containing protein [Candidatus Eremiobacteraeota bacterium]